LLQWDGEVEVYGSDGNILPEGIQLSEFMWEVIPQAFRYSAENSATIDPQKSLYNFFEEKVIEKYGPGSGKADLGQIMLKMSELWGAFVGSSIKTQSLKFFWLEECIEGGLLPCLPIQRMVSNVHRKPIRCGNLQEDPGLDRKASTRRSKTQSWDYSYWYKDWLRSGHRCNIRRKQAGV
jgi:hypothetical protein